MGPRVDGAFLYIFGHIFAVTLRFAITAQMGPPTLIFRRPTYPILGPTYAAIVPPTLFSVPPTLAPRLSEARRKSVQTNHTSEPKISHR